MAIDSFRQLILDAQAMMDPDFAGKLSADVAAGTESGEDADTGFEFGASSADSASTEDKELPQPDASKISPFAAQPKRPSSLGPGKSNSARSRC